MKGLWFYYAGVYKGLPLDDRSALEIMTLAEAQPSEPRDRYIYYAGSAEVPESVAVNIQRRSYTIAAGVEIESPDAEGVLFAHGGVAGGHASSSRTEGSTTSTTGWAKCIRRSSSGSWSAGKHVLTAEFEKTGDDRTRRAQLGR